jgi:hypothetical protein
MLMFVRDFSHNRAGNGHFSEGDLEVPRQKVQHVALWRSLASTQKVKCRTSGGTEQCRFKAGAGSFFVFAVNRCLLAFDENLR